MPDGDAKLRLSIPSARANIELLALVASASMRHLGLGDESLEPVMMALREAVANGVVHGNRLAPEKHVEVVIWLDGDDAVIEVRDEGGGFDPDSVPNPLAPENLLKASGRGIFLMNRTMDRVEFRFDGRGTEVVMRKRLRADTSDAVAAGAE